MAENAPSALTGVTHWIVDSAHPTRLLPSLGQTRRRVAIALLACLVWLSAAPLGFALRSPESDLPACCRSTGAHHCSMKDAPGQSREATLTGGRCRAFAVHAPALLQPSAHSPVAASPCMTLPSSAVALAGWHNSSAEVRLARVPRGPPSASTRAPLSF